MLILLPNLLHPNSLLESSFVPIMKEKVLSLSGLIAESEKEGRRFLKRFLDDFRKLPIALLNKHSHLIDPLLSPLQKGETWGLISDAGLPTLADPGAHLVRRLHCLKIHVETLPGPSSIIMALQLSGFFAQRFTFYGYPPHEEGDFRELLRTLPKEHPYIFIETPYKTDRLFKFFLDHSRSETELSISWSLMSNNQGTQTDSIAKWRETNKVFGKVPAVFIIKRKKI